MINTALDSKINRIISATNEALGIYGCMTVRQTFYQLVVMGVISNNLKSYTQMCKVLTKARREGLIDWRKILDHTTKYYGMERWETLEDFLRDCKKSFRLIPRYDNDVEVWIEKDALSWVHGVVGEYNIPTVCMVGYGKYTAFQKLKERTTKERDVYILLLTDYDPSGENISQKIQEEGFCVKKIALTREQVKEYNLPSVPAKTSDPRTIYGDVKVQVELDALPPDALREIIREELNLLIRPDEVARMKAEENEIHATLEKIFGDRHD